MFTVENVMEHIDGVYSNATRYCDMIVNDNMETLNVLASNVSIIHSNISRLRILVEMNNSSLQTGVYKLYIDGHVFK